MIINSWLQIQPQYFEQLSNHYQRWSDLYTDLRLTTDIRVATYNGQRIEFSGEKGQWWFREALTLRDLSGKLRREKVIILGDPGGGKSTACERAVWELAQDGLKANKTTSSITPIYLDLGAYREDRSDLQGLAPYERILNLFTQKIESFIGKVEINWVQLKQYMEQCPFLFLMDGLNEVGERHRLALIRDVKDFIDTFVGKHHQFVITTRKFDYEYEFVQYFSTQEFEPLEILELNQEGITEFIMRDLGQIAQAYTFIESLPSDKQAMAKKTLDALKRGDVTTGKNLFAELEQSFQEQVGIIANIKKAWDLWELLQLPDYGRIQWLAKNPGTLRDIIDVYDNKGSIPRSRTRLFERAIEARLEIQRDKRNKKGESTIFSKEDKFKVLQPVAFQMMQADQGLIISHDEIVRGFEKYLFSESVDPLLKELIFSDGLLVEKEKGWYGFVKQPYQEYFVACELRDRWRSIAKEGQDPLHDPRMQQFLQNRFYFQVTAGMAGLLNSQEVSDLVKLTYKQKSTQRLAALCVRNAEDLPLDFIKEFIDWTRQRIQKFTLFPEGLTNTILVISMALLFLFFWNIDLHTIFLSVTLILSILSPWVLSFALVAFSIGIRLVLQQLYQLTGKGGWSTFDSGAVLLVFISLPIILLGFANNNIGVVFNVLSIIAFFTLTFRLIYLIVVPGVVWLDIRLEEFVVNNYLIHYLEVLRDMGREESDMAIKNFQAELSKNQYISERIKDVINRTWAVSPKTVLQIIDHVQEPTRQVEIVRVIAPTILRNETDYTVREQCLVALFFIVRQQGNLGALLEAIDLLGRLAKEEVVYQKRVHALLKQVINNHDYSLYIRFYAWRVLGQHNLRWPQLTFRETIRVWGPAVVMMLPALCAATFWVISFFI